MPQPRSRMRDSIVYGSLPPGVKWLLIVNVAVFLLQSFGGQAIGDFLRILRLFPEMVFYSFPWYLWQLVTYMFLHGGVSHILFNMLALWMFGVVLEQTWGTRAFLKYYFLCGIGAGICDVVVNVILGHRAPTLGASGAIYGLLMAFGVLFPDTTLLMNFLFPIKAKYLVMIYGAIALYSALGSNDGVSNVAHLGGMLFGFVYLKARLPRVGMRLPDMGGWYRQWKMQRAKKKFQVYMRKNKGQGPWVN